MLIIFYNLSLKAQTNLAEQILGMIDSSAAYVENGRKLIINNSQQGNFAKNIEVLKFLRSKVDENEYVLLFPSEERLVCFMAQDNDAFLNSFVVNPSWENKQLPPNDHLNTLLIDELQQELPMWSGWLEEQTLNDEEKQLYRLYLGEINYYTDKAQLLKETKRFLKHYPNSSYATYVNSLKGTFFTGSMGYSLTLGDFMHSGDVYDWVNLKGMFSMEMNYFLNRFYWSLYFQGSTSGSLKFDVTGVADDGAIFNYHAGNKASYVTGGFRFGYLLYQNKWFKVYPFGSIASSNVSTLNNTTGETSMYLTKGMGLGAGLGTDIDIFNWNSKQPVYGFIHQHIGLRLNGGYEKTLHKSIYFSNNTLFFTAGLVWWMGD